LTLRAWVWVVVHAGLGELDSGTSLHPSPKNLNVNRDTLRPERLPNAKSKGASPARALRVFQRTRRSARKFPPPEVPASLPLRSPVAPTSLPLVDLVPLECCSDDCGGIGFPAPATARVFHLGLAVSLRPRPLHLSMKVSSSCELSAPAESCGLRAALSRWSNLATRPTAEERLPWGGSSSLIATSAGGVHHSQGSRPAVTFRPRRFSSPRRFPPPPAFAGCFNPAARPGVCLSGDVPHARAVPGFPGRVMPSCV